MFTSNELLVVTVAYLSLLFLIAYYAERRERLGRSLVANPYVYSLSMAVYCTSWTFYGSVGHAATSGLSFLTIYLGPTLMATLWGLVMTRIIRIARDNRITTIADFIGSRYGNSIALSALVTVVATVGITPYLGLQVKAIISTFTIMSGHKQGGAVVGWLITMIIGFFAVSFGVRTRALTDKHEGLVFAIAFESIVKLVAFVLVGVYVTFVLFRGHFDIFRRISESDYSYLMGLGGHGPGDYSQWASLMFLSMMAIMFLPRQFQMAVVENYDVKHVTKAMWLFPLYLFLINFFVLPVAYGGLLLGGKQEAADFFVLTIPLMQGKSMLALFVFIGGISAASSMIIVESMAISNMVMNNIVNPVIYRYNAMKGFSLIISNIKSSVILGLVLVGYLFAMYVGEFYSLVNMGLKSFEAVSIFAPSFLIGMYWKRGNLKGAIAGIAGGFVVWVYTLLMPTLMHSGILERGGLISRMHESSLLNPDALFGLRGLDQWSHSLFWGMFVNITLYVLVSVMTSQSAEEEKQALLFVESYAPRVFTTRSSLKEIDDVLMHFLGEQQGRSAMDEMLERIGARRQDISHSDLMLIREEAQRVLSGLLGTSVASIVFQDRLPQTEQEKSELLGTIKQMGTTLRSSRQELARANRELELLKEFSENIIESLPLGVTTLDESMRVTYWNQEMQRITGVNKADAMGEPADLLLQCMEPGLFSPSIREGEIACSTGRMELKGNVSRLTGGAGGYVIVLEDITEKKKIEEELFRTTKHASIGRLAAGVSHEVGNPLASISSLVQELMAGGSTPEFLNKSLNTVHHNVNRIARIVRNLGDFARINPRQKVPTSIGETLDRTLNLVRLDKNFRKVNIRTEIEETPPLKVDPDQLQQVFLNIMLNARDAMSDGGEMTITVARAGDSVRIAFSDTGGGIPVEIAEHIFDPFFTTKGPGGGTGLGLSISYSIIKDHGGSLSILPVIDASGAVVGSSFVIDLPA